MNDLFSEKHIFKVSELTRGIRDILEENFSYIWVEGEISTLRIPPSGHMYFTLKDDKSQLKCVFFKGANMRLNFKMEDGLACILFGRISVYEQSGQYQLIVEKAEPQGKGALQLKFEQLKKKLAEEGLFDKETKQELPFLPQRIGIVTSSTGAAIRDILNIIDRRYSNVHIVIRPSLVQGKTAAKDIAQGIKDLNAYKDIDVIIVGRGGGSLEDLWAFNEEPVARAVYESKIPVISAVGHEIDFTICDFVADLRAPTPSAAAELVVQEKARLESDLDDFKTRLYQAISKRIKFAYLNLKSCHLRRPEHILERYQQRLDMVDGAMLSSLKRTVDKYKHSFESIGLGLIGSFAHRVQSKQADLKQMSARLLNLNPLAILARGYSVTYLDKNGEMLKNIAQVKKNDILRTKLSKGVIISQVKETTI